ncbi:MAG TPA: DUF4397 domain-containing protein, partial [Ilumatobacter sp.]|nr:DUF4397 domain-containing protein [Ilumatobacter sp.]
VAAPPSYAAPAQTASTGWARFGHFAPGAGPVDVLVDGELFATDITFKTATEYAQLPSGVHAFELVPAGADGPVALQTTVGVPDGGAVTVAAVTTRDGLSPRVFDDALMMPQQGRSLVRFIHAAPEAPAVDISVVGGPVLAAAVPYPGATEYLDVAPGAYDVQVTDSTTAQVVLEVQGWTIEPGVQATIVIVAGADGQLDVAPLVDTASAAVVPVGGVQTGYGGMAGQDRSTPIISATLAWILLASLGLGVVALAAVAERRRACQSL